MDEDTIGRYRRLVREGAIDDDDAQRAAIEKLQLIYRRLEAARPAIRFSDLFRRRRAEPGDGGLYLYGGVGRGKSMLMDIFFETVQMTGKRRVHFHAFMEEIHAGIRRARSRSAGNPVQVVAAGVASGTRLLCFDEFQVENIADAMILGQLFELLFSSEVTVVLTSNLPPSKLYRDGLNRDQFLPFVMLIEERLDLHHLEGPKDFRKGAWSGEVYFSPLGSAAAVAMDEAWRRMAGTVAAVPRVLRVHGRKIAFPRANGALGRADFEALCGAPHGPGDFLAIADAFETLFLDGVPRIPPERRDTAKRFMILIDALYEAQKNFVCSADGEPEDLFPKGHGSQEFHRTASRLHEMRSAAYRATE